MNFIYIWPTCLCSTVISVSYQIGLSSEINYIANAISSCMFSNVLQTAVQVYDFPCGNINLSNQNEMQTFITYWLTSNTCSYQFSPCNTVKAIEIWSSYFQIHFYGKNTFRLPNFILICIVWIKPVMFIAA